MTQTAIHLPDADDLDTAGLQSGSGLKLYLVPGAESDDGIPEIGTHHYIGRPASWPMAAHHGLWVCVGDVPAGVVGESVLEGLRAATEALLALDTLYLGSEWDGSNRRGRWEETDLTHHVEERIREGLRTYWDASDYYTPAGIGWEGACEIADIEPERALSDLSAAVEAVTKALEDDAKRLGDEVAGIESYVERCAERWVEERDEDEDGDEEDGAA